MPQQPPATDLPAPLCPQADPDGSLNPNLGPFAVTVPAAAGTKPGDTVVVRWGVDGQNTFTSGVNGDNAGKDLTVGIPVVTVKRYWGKTRVDYQVFQGGFLQGTSKPLLLTVGLPVTGPYEA